MDRRLLGTLIAFSALLGLVWLLVRVLEPFLPALGWGMVIAIASFPLYQRLADRTGGPRLRAPLLMTTLIFLVVLVPVIVLATLLVGELLQAENFMGQAGEGGISNIGKTLQQHPLFGPLLDKAYRLAQSAGIDLRATAAQAAKATLGLLTSGITSLITNFFQALLNLLLVMVILFFLYRDGPLLESAFWELVNLPADEQERQRTVAHGIISGVVFGVLLTALAQGILGGIGFWFAGLPSPLLFGFLTFVASLVPVVGTLLVWVPAAIYLFATDHTTMAVVFVAWNVFAVGGADNILRPILIGSRVEMPVELTMLGALGGLFSFGMLGLVIGPLIIAAALLAFRLLVATQANARARE